MSKINFKSLSNYKPKRKHIFQNNFSFWKIFRIWFLIILCFGLVYRFFQNDVSYLYNTISNQPVTSLIDTIYFSFVSATTTGFGDIVPFGWFKLIATIELVSGLLILALVTSKLVSMKQEAIMEELYDISFNDKINNLRSSLLLFRQKINKARFTIEDGKFRKRNLGGVDSILANFEDTLRDINLLLQRQSKSGFTKKIDSTNAELLFNSILSSVQRLKQFLEKLKETSVDFSDDVLVSQVKTLGESLKKLCKEINKTDHKENEPKIQELVTWFEEF